MSAAFKCAKWNVLQSREPKTFREFRLVNYFQSKHQTSSSSSLPLLFPRLIPLLFFHLLFLRCFLSLLPPLLAQAQKLGGNAVVGYRQVLDIEGDSGVVVRGIGTVVTIHSRPESTLSKRPKVFKQFSTPSPWVAVVVVAAVVVVPVASSVAAVAVVELRCCFLGNLIQS